jgi:hypothetical protein
MELVLYGFPIFVFIILSVIMYTISESSTKNEPSTIFLKYILPSAVISIILFSIIKFKDSMVFSDEPMKTGSFYGNTQEF